MGSELTNLCTAMPLSGSSTSTIKVSVMRLRGAAMKQDYLLILLLSRACRGFHHT